MSLANRTRDEKLKLIRRCLVNAYPIEAPMPVRRIASARAALAASTTLHVASSRQLPPRIAAGRGPG